MNKCFGLEETLAFAAAISLGVTACDSDSTSANSNNDEEVSSSSVAEESSSSVTSAPSSSSVKDESSSSVSPDTDPESSSSSAEIEESSSSVAPTSSNKKTAWDYLNPDIDYGEFTDERDGQVYKTVKIGNQVWMAQNLNYAYTAEKYDGLSTSLDSTSFCYDNNPENCAKYGRLYTWAAAVGIPQGHGVSSLDLDKTVQGICPDGWRLPELSEWYEFEENVFEFMEYEDDNLSMLFKSSDGWNKDKNGRNASGFTLLPAGVGALDGDYEHVGESTCFWTSSTYRGCSSCVYIIDLKSSSNELEKGVVYAYSYSRSVRCIKDSASKQPSSSSSAVSSSSVESNSSTISSSSEIVPGCPQIEQTKTSWMYLNPEIDYEEFVDSRDCQKYKTVKIGDQTWMAENLNYAYNKPMEGADSSSFCFENSKKRCENLGRLYPWSVATKVCPEGWHLPSKTEWKTLIDFVGENSGVKLKSTISWDMYNGTNDVGFSALPGGYLEPDDGEFYLLGGIGNFWSSDESSANSATHLQLYFSVDVAQLGAELKAYGYSVRCLKD
ncbi:MAG: fibrobacter succinogenes major paralogous domain-containing protein [Fibrobacter sp.]|nr:fibrobacter succinogenes major paralogous domain-containing protein [Fibrobacter sp.]